MLLSDLLDLPHLGLVPVVAPAAADLRIRGVYTTDLPDPGRYLEGGELVLTSSTWYRRAHDADVFVAALASAGAAGLVAGTAMLGELPNALPRSCERHGLALFTVDDDVSFATLTETVLAALARRPPHAGLHRELIASMASGAGPEGLAEVFTRATGIGCAVLSATGRPLTRGGTAGAADGNDHLGRAHREALASGSFPCVQPVPGKGGSLTFFPVQSPVARRPPAAYLAAAGDFRDWAPGVADAAAEVCTLLAMDRVARQESRRIEERLLREAVDLLREGEADGAESRLRGLGLDPGSPMRAVYVGTSGGPYGGELAAVVLDDVAARIPGCSAAIAEADTDACLMLVPATGAGEEIRTPAAQVEEAIRGLGPLLVHGWAAVGTGKPGTGAAGLRRSLEEAGHLLRIARLGSGTYRTADDAALSSYLLLLASVPDEVRQLYRDRLIGVLERYDKQHRSDLIGTLTTFLDASGSWNRCADQLHVHVNTLRYRLHRIEQLTGHSLTTLRDRVDFCLALSIR
ncbi:PucR family transcriptional regulator ligand-binding domain-containing protein [Streptomyces sp. NPDC002088]|uniref:helix-turn-helix domain-containing protein n=1 Tax=Streptomyces sp. NPDC002088 TaxID=3154665 RepID=UPI00331D2570